MSLDMYMYHFLSRKCTLTFVILKFFLNPQHDQVLAQSFMMRSQVKWAILSQNMGDKPDFCSGRYKERVLQRTMRISEIGRAFHAKLAIK